MLIIPWDTMTAVHWSQVKELFSRCLNVPADKRPELLAETTCAPTVRAEVMRLLLHQENLDPKFMESLFPPQPAILADGTVLSERFRIVRLLGQGGMGAVYEAMDGELSETVALKTLNIVGQPAESFARFRRELQLARRVTHPNVCRVFEFNRCTLPSGEVHFLTMELLPGESLAAFIGRGGILSLSEARDLLCQVLRGLEAVHAMGIIHRDLKPGNVMIVPQGIGLVRAVLMDFGLARPADDAIERVLTQSLRIMGTVGYMAPEQISGGPVSAQTDLFAFGITMSEVLLGRTKTNKEETNEQRLDDTVPLAWREVMERCLHTDPVRRPSSASEIRSVLEKRLPLSGRFSRRIWLSTAAGAVGAAAAGSYFVWRSRGPVLDQGTQLLVVNPTGTDGGAIGVQIRSVLRQSARISIWDNARAAQIWAQMGRPADAVPSAKEWRELALRDSVSFILFPSVTAVGDGASVTLRVEFLGIDPESPANHWQQSFEASDPNHLFEAISSSGTWLRRLIGESEREISATTIKPQAVTTPSWPALTEFSRGEALLSGRDREGAVLAFASATRIDPLFTMAWARSGDVLTSLGRDREGFGSWQQAAKAAIQRPLSRREDLKFRAMFASDCANYAEAERLFKEYTSYFSGESYGMFNRALPLFMLGRAAEAIGDLERCTSFPQVRRQAWLHLAVARMCIGRPKEAQVSVQKLSELGSRPRAEFVQAVIAHASGETDASLRALKGAAEDPTLVTPAKAIISKAIVLADGGRTDEAIDLLSSTDDAAMGERDRWAERRLHLAVLLEQEGERAKAAEAIWPLRKAEIGPEQTGRAGVLFARFGRPAQANELLAALPEDLAYPRFQIPRLQVAAEIRFHEGAAQDGLRLARRAAAMEPPGLGSAHLAESLEGLGQEEEALMEYRDCLRARCLQLFLANPSPAGSWFRAASAVHLLESKQRNSARKGMP